MSALTIPDHRPDRFEIKLDNDFVRKLGLHERMKFQTSLNRFISKANACGYDVIQNIDADIERETRLVFVKGDLDE